jgi:hypothetical protein
MGPGGGCCAQAVLVKAMAAVMLQRYFFIQTILCGCTDGVNSPSAQHVHQAAGAV